MSHLEHAVERDFLHDTLDERGLTLAVVSDERHLLPPLDGEVDMREHQMLSVGLRHLVADEWEVSASRTLREFEVEACCVDVVHLYNLHTFERLHAALHLIGLGGLISELLDESLGLLDFLTLILVGSELLLPPLVAQDDILVVLHLVVVDMSARDFYGAVGHVVDKRTVVADEDDRVGLLLDKLLEPLDGPDVEVVGRLVEQKEVGLGQQELGQLDSHTPSPRELARGSGEVLLTESQSDECPFDFRLIVETTHHVEALVLMCEAFDELKVVVRVVVGASGQLVVHGRQTLLHHLHLREGFLRLLHDRGVVADDHDLREIANRGLLLHGDGTRGGALESRDDLEERGLARPVLSDESDALLGIDDEGDILKEGFRRKFY